MAKHGVELLGLATWLQRPWDKRLNFWRIKNIQKSFHMFFEYGGHLFDFFKISYKKSEFKVNYAIYIDPILGYDMKIVVSTLCGIIFQWFEATEKLRRFFFGDTQLFAKTSPFLFVPWTWLGTLAPFLFVPWADIWWVFVGHNVCFFKQFLQLLKNTRWETARKRQTWFEMIWTYLSNLQNINKLTHLHASKTSLALSVLGGHVRLAVAGGHDGQKSLEEPDAGPLVSAPDVWRLKFHVVCWVNKHAPPKKGPYDG